MKTTAPVILCSSVASLLLLGVVLLDSATVAERNPARLSAHVASMALGVIIAAMVALADYRWLQRRPLPQLLLGAGVLGLVLVLIPGVGEWVHGARRWFRFGGQPSEFVKVAFLVWCADYGARHHAHLEDARRGFVIPAAALAGVAGLIFIEPDWGTALLLTAAGLVVFLAAGAPFGRFAALGVVAGGLVAVLLRHDPVRWARLMSFLDLERDQHGVGWQQWHSILALGAGGLHGTFFGGGHHKFGFVPEQQTDFVFSLLGEELGLCGTLLFVVLYLGILGTGSCIAWRASDLFGRLLATGLTALITCQALINLAVATGSLPNKGIPLPFVSYGGSDLVSLLTAVGLLVAIGRKGTAPDRDGRSNEPGESEAVRARRAQLQALPLRATREGRWIAWLRAFTRSRARTPFGGIKSYQRPPRARDFAPPGPCPGKLINGSDRSASLRETSARPDSTHGAPWGKEASATLAQEVPCETPRSFPW